MKLFRFDAEMGHSLDVFDSVNFTYLPILQTTKTVKISCLRLGKNGVIGYHQATVSQLFLVVAGSGWVCSEDRRLVAIRTGQAAFWEENEWHETTTKMGLTAVVVEGPALNPAHYLTPKE